MTGDQPSTVLCSGRLTAPGVALIALCYGIARFAYGLFVPAFRLEFALSDTLLGVIGAGSYVGYCLAIVVSAALVARFGARPVATAAGVVATVGMTLVAAAPTPWVLAGAVLLAGSSTGIASPPLADALARWLPATAQTRAQSVVNAGPGAGIALSGPVALLAVDNWRIAWWGFAVLGAIVTAWVLFALPREPNEHPYRASCPPLKATLVGPAAWRLAAAAALFGAASACAWTFGRDHLTLTGGHSETTTIVLWIVLGVAGLAGAAGGDLIARHGLVSVWRSGLAALALATAAMGLLPGHITAVVLAMTFFGASYMTLTIVVFFAALSLSPAQPAAMVGLGFLMITLGQALGAPLAGVLIDGTGPTSAFLAFSAVGALTLLITPTTQPPDHRGIPVVQPRRHSGRLRQKTPRRADSEGERDSPS